MACCVMENNVRTNVHCCLCLQTLQASDDTAWKKKKLLHKASCEKSKRIINEVLFNKLQLSLDSFTETRDPQAYLCNFCDLLATNVEKNRAKLKAAEEELVEKVSNLTRLVKQPVTEGG